MSMYLGGNLVAPTKISNNTYGWLGPNVEYVGKLYEWNGTMADTTYADWTPSTSSATILSSVSSAFTFTRDATDTSSYYLVGGWDNKFVYNSGTTLQAASTHFVSMGVYTIYPTFNNYSSYINSTFDTWSSRSTMSFYYLEYYNTSGNLTGQAISYAPAYNTTSISMQSSNNTTYNFYRPSLSARCSSTYFSTSVAPQLDLTASTLNYRIDVFKRPSETNCMESELYSLLSDKLKNNYGF